MVGNRRLYFRTPCRNLKEGLRKGFKSEMGNAVIKENVQAGSERCALQGLWCCCMCYTENEKMKLGLKNFCRRLPAFGHCIGGRTCRCIHHVAAPACWGSLPHEAEERTREARASTPLALRRRARLPRFCFAFLLRRARMCACSARAACMGACTHWYTA